MHYPTVGTLLIFVPLFILALYYLFDYVERVYFDKTMSVTQQEKLAGINKNSGLSLVTVFLLALAGFILFNIFLFVTFGDAIAYLFLPLLLKEFLIFAPCLLLYLIFSQYKKHQRYKAAEFPASFLNYSRFSLLASVASFLLLVLVYAYYYG
jgi:hypothetical protein